MTGLRNKSTHSSKEEMNALKQYIDLVIIILQTGCGICQNLGTIKSFPTESSVQVLLTLRERCAILVLL